MLSLILSLTLVDSQPPAIAHDHASSCALCHHAALDPEVGYWLAYVERRTQIDDERHQRDIQRDIELGREVSEEIDKVLEPSENEEMIERVVRIGTELAEIANETQVEVTWGDPRLSPFPYEFRVVKGDDVNAFSLPGGIIYVYEGLVDFSTSDHELAGVLGHEIAHAAFRHIATLRREQSRLDIVNLSAMVAAILTGGETASVIVGSMSMLNLAFQSGWSVEAEFAADQGAIHYLRNSSYDPVGVLVFMERLFHRNQLFDSIDWGILRTHPPSRERAIRISSTLRSLEIPILRSKVSPLFSARIEPNDDGGLDLKFASRRIHTFSGAEAIPRADDALARVNAFFDSEPSAFEVEISGSRIIGFHRVLFEVTRDDALEMGMSVNEATRAAEEALKWEIRELNRKRWTLRTR